MSYLFGTFLEYYMKINMKLLRILKALISLRAFSKVKNLKIILSALIFALPLLKVSFLLLIVFYYLFAIFGLQLFHGMLKMNCFFPKFGIGPEKKIFCGNVVCSSEFICGKSN